MTTAAIVVDSISKRYQLAPRHSRHDSLAEQVTSAVSSVWRRRARSSEDQTLWALKDVSFSISEGEVVGVIGANGAGKSTILKILSRITTPTSGTARIHGRVSSLLEVGTGFQPELSGRENVYLSAAILGMRRADTNRRFDDIVDFSGVGRFIDTPVKRYSSGMYVRLAFAVAAHLDPDIILVDEVLAVGDAAFQKKCLGKMKDVVTQGRTVLFVSHNMAAVANLCPRSLLFESGRIAVEGSTQTVIDRYLHRLSQNEATDLAARADRQGSQVLTFVGIELRNARGTVVDRVQCGQAVTIALHYRTHGRASLNAVRAAIGIHGRYDERLFDLTNDLNGFLFDRLPSRGTLLCHVPCLPLQPGSYSFNAYCEIAGETADWVHNAGSIEVEPGDFFGSGRLPPVEQGPFLVHHSWTVEEAKPCLDYVAG
jgi:lipopolysaccharide transport system ATP-binding protein